MAQLKKTFPYVFSRLRNSLVELQRWWPGYIKNQGGDGSNGLSVDPVLYRTNFGTNTAEDEGGLNDEANTPGVRCEVVNDGGGSVSGTYTLTISGSGTYNPKATLNYNGTSYSIMLIAPDSATEQGNGAPYAKTVTPTSYWAEAGSPGDEMNSAGPYPVFMTLQEFAESFDTGNHVGQNDDNKVAFMPFGLVGRTGGVAATAKWVGGGDNWDGDPRLSPASEAVENQTMLKWISTVFMPMMLDNNQLGNDISNADVSFAWPHDPNGPAGCAFDGYKQQGITRYDADPDTGTAGVKYKTVQTSGDFLKGACGAWSSYQTDTVAGTQFSGTYYSHAGAVNTTNGYSNPDGTLASSAAIGPKYRMRMALACFLKDGTYTLNDGGSIIPYVYDSTRVIGGKITSTLYSVWDGRNGYGNTQDYKYDCSAQIYPMFDFIQGPLCPSAQGNNFDTSVIELEHPSFPKIVTDQALATTGQVQPRQFLVRPNPKRAKVLAVSKSSTGLLQVVVKSSTTF